MNSKSSEAECVWELEEAVKNLDEVIGKVIEFNNYAMSPESWKLMRKCKDDESRAKSQKFDKLKNQMQGDVLKLNEVKYHLGRAIQYFEEDMEDE